MEVSTLVATTETNLRQRGGHNFPCVCLVQLTDSLRVQDLTVKHIRDEQCQKLILTFKKRTIEQFCFCAFQIESLSHLLLKFMCNPNNSWQKQTSACRMLSSVQPNYECVAHLQPILLWAQLIWWSIWERENWLAIHFVPFIVFSANRARKAIFHYANGNRSDFYHNGNDFRFIHAEAIVIKICRGSCDASTTCVRA